MISVSIVTFHTPLDELRTCLKCLDSDRVSHIYIIDNGCDPAINLLARQYHKVTYIPHPNHGYGTGHNRAMRRVLEYRHCDPYHLVMNSDVVFDPEILERMERFMDDNTDVATLQPKLVAPDGSLQYSCRQLPTPIDLILRRFMPRCIGQSKRSRYLLKHIDLDREQNVPNHQGSFMLLRTSALREVGLFDERFFMYSEDIDLSRRLHRHYRTLYWPHGVVVHAYRAASYHSLRMLLVHTVSIIKYFNKWGWIKDHERTTFNRRLNDSNKK